jgi:hypothetical protein
VKKWLAILLLIISVAGSFIPCCPNDGCEDEAVEAVGSSHNDTDQSDKGACSPFYSCGTCVSAIDITAAKYQLVEPANEKITHFSFCQFQLSRYSASLFQPPRVFLVS